jgi:Protein of unknown function (DUF2281)
MNLLAERIYEVSKELPEPALAELLDFAEFLQQRKLRAGEQTMELVSANAQRGSVMRTLALLASPRFAQRPKASDAEVAQRITALRNDWDGRG